MGDPLIIQKCLKLLSAYRGGQLGKTEMPEDSNPGNFKSQEDRLSYFTLPMALNYQRDSFSLWRSALETYRDTATRDCFDVELAAKMSQEKLRACLTGYKLALQPNKHVDTWQRLAKTFYNNWGSIEQFVMRHESDFLKIRETIQHTNKRDFPYLSGPKIFNYWSHILGQYGKVSLKNRSYIEIAPDTHIIKCSVRLGLITRDESQKLSRDQISERWRKVLHGSGIDPIDMHSPLWFWSRGGFVYNLESNSEV